jgi:hypothetical protein
MKLSADPTSPDYHELVHFIDKILLDNTPLDNVIAIDRSTRPHKAQCFTLPMVVKAGMVDTHQVTGEIGVEWRVIPTNSAQHQLFNQLYHDWTQRELTRLGVTDVEPKTL